VNADYEDIVVDVTDPVAVITLNRPDRLNAFRTKTMHELRSAVEQVADDERVVGIVVTGVGRGFCVGLDSADLAQAADPGTAPRSSRERPEEAPALFSYLLDVPKPVIAAVNGMCAGGGFVLAMMCDLRFAADTAVFNTVFSRRGLVSEHGTSWLLPRIVGLSRALDLLWSSRSVSAEEAHRIGLADRLVESDALVATASDYIRVLAQTTAPQSLKVIKRLTYGHLDLPWPEAAVEADAAMQASVADDDFREGVASYLEKRPPRFRRVGSERPAHD
jgi:enoyl-CoA hydratase/carnithine racemase